MQHRRFLNLAAGAAAGAVLLAQAAMPVAAAPLAPLTATGTIQAQPAVVGQDVVDHMKPEEVRWHRGWHRRHGGWHRHRWHRRHW